MLEYLSKVKATSCSPLARGEKQLLQVVTLEPGLRQAEGDEVGGQSGEVPGLQRGEVQVAEVEVEQRGQGGHQRGEAGHAPSPELGLRHVQGLQPTEARPGEELQRAGLDSDRGVGRGDGEPTHTWLSLALAILILLHSQGLLPTWYKYLKEQNIIIHHLNGR